MAFIDTLRILGHASAISLFMFVLMWVSGAFSGLNRFQKQS